jgi:hypothetical protein
VSGLLNKIKPYRDITEQERKVGELPAFFINDDVAVIDSAVRGIQQKDQVAA